MNNTYVIQTIIEFLLAVFFIWGLFNEPKLAKLEKKFFAKFSKKNKTNKGYRNAA